jgi:hypothetical protein
MGVDVVIRQGVSGPIPDSGGARVAQLHLQNGRNYVVLAKGQVHPDADLDVTLRLHAFLDTATSDEVRLLATNRDGLAAPAVNVDGHVIQHTVHDVSAAFMLAITVSVPDDDDGFFTTELGGRSNIAGRQASFTGLRMIGLPADSFVTD